MSPPVALGPGQLAIAALLVLVAGGVSLGLRLGLERRLLWASVRTVAQLVLVGHILEWVFAVERAAVVLGILLVMTALAGRAAVQRSARTYRGATAEAVFTLAVTGLATTLTVTGVVIQVEPFLRAQYVIPLLGMVLGNSLTGISLCLDSLLETLDRRRTLVEAALALGATRWEAMREPIAEAVRRGMIPIINAMMVAGVVSLPGMMTGQILAGTPPLEAVMYQVVVMFMIAAASAIGSMGVALLAFRRLTNTRHQLLAERIRRRA